MGKRGKGGPLRIGVFGSDAGKSVRDTEEGREVGEGFDVHVVCCYVDMVM